MMDDFAETRRAICANCEHRQNRRCGLEVQRGKRGVLESNRGIHNPKAKCRDGRWGRVGEVDISLTTNEPANTSQVALLTTHYNPQRYDRLRETYYEWLPTLGPLAERLTCYELVFDDDEPEIEGSTVIRGTRERNTLWQKEAMLNIGFRSLSDSVRYVGWIDHDIVNHDPDWLTKAISAIDSGSIAVQLFAKLLFLDTDRTVISEKLGAIHHGSGAPGGGWLASREFIDRIDGLWTYDIMGGGDEAFYAATARNASRMDSYIERHREAAQLKRWIAKVKLARGGQAAQSLRSTCSHLYHGQRKNRRYDARQKIPLDHGYTTDCVEIDSNGLLTWTDAAPAKLREEVSRYFADRKEDE